MDTEWPLTSYSAREGITSALELVLLICQYHGASQLEVQVFHDVTFISKGILQDAVTHKTKFQTYLALSK